MLRRLLVAITLLLVLAVIPGLSDLALSGPSQVGQPDDIFADQMRDRIWQVAPRAQPANLVVVSPPPGLGVPVGQYIGVCYYFEGESPAVLELVADSEEVVRELVQPGQRVTHAWTPTQAGAHQIRVQVRAPDGAVQASSGLNVTGLADGERVQVPRFFFPFGSPWLSR